MFERNRIDNATANSAHQTAVAVVITLTDGETLAGHFYFSAARALTDVLNGESQFLDFQPLSGNRRFIAKRAIGSVALSDAPAATALDVRRPQSGDFDPYTALGVKTDTPWDDVRDAYLKLAKKYHADRYASIDLPAEVREYLAQMSKRVNAAYTMLEAPRLVVRKAEYRPAPVYTSRPRV